ncbi:TOBE domain-containing protein [Actinoplanes sp. TFC3]|uniref:TOBE domain-containing protein n=1 Tax=Actinoplanes sp. TFC3 TaxID=1710355 RepID=UPI00082ED61F|nr:TOBE domain-containing protein [Actinoplanes sp. TFC3]
MSLTGTVESAERLGGEVIVRVDVGGVPASPLAVRVPARAPAAPGTRVTVGIHANDLLLFDRDGDRIRFDAALDRIS